MLSRNIKCMFMYLIRSASNSRQRNAPLSPHSPHSKSGQTRGKASAAASLDSTHRSKRRPGYSEASSRSNRPPSPSGPRRSEEKRLLPSKNHRVEEKVRDFRHFHFHSTSTTIQNSVKSFQLQNNHGTSARDRLATTRSHVIEDDDDSPVKHSSSRSARQPPTEYPARAKARVPDIAQAALAAKKKGKDKIEKVSAS